MAKIQRASEQILKLLSSKLAGLPAGSAALFMDVAAQPRSGPWRGALEASSRGLALVGFAGAALVEGMAPAAVLGAALLLLPAAYLSRQPKVPAYQAAWNLATILFVGISLLFNHWTLESTLRTLATLCCFLHLHRAFNHRTPRHYFQIWLLTVASLILAPLSLEVPPVRYALLLGAFFALSAVHLGAIGWMKDSLAIEAAAAPQPSPEIGTKASTREARRLGANVGSAERPALSAGALEAPQIKSSYWGVWLRLTALSGVATAVLFLAFPRPFAPPFPDGGAAMRSARARQRLITGLSQGIDLGYLTDLREDPTPAAWIRGLPPLLRENCRLRAAALDYFDGERWMRVPSSKPPMRIERRAEAPEFRWREPLSSGRAGGRWIPAYVTLADLPYRYLLSASEAIGAGGFTGDLHIEEDGALLPSPEPEAANPLSGPAQAARYNSPSLFASGAGAKSPLPAAISSPAGQESGIKQYTLYFPESPEGFWRDSNGPPPASASLAQFSPPNRWLFQWPNRIPRAPVETLSRRVTAGATSDNDRARMIEMHLRRQGEYSHNLEAYSSSGGAAALESFLKSAHPRGHCELFASAMVLMTRSIGIPSRLAVGFLGGEVKEETDELCIRCQDAHAWVEVWLPDVGWRTFDPTPAAPLESMSSRLSFLELRRWTRGVLTGWRDLALNSGASASGGIPAWAAAQLERWAAGVFPESGSSEAWRKLKEGFKDPWVWMLAALLMAGNIVIALALKRLRRAAEAHWPLRARWLPQPRTALWPSLRRRISEAAGVAAFDKTRTGQTFSEYLEIESRRGMDSWPALAAALRLYESKRFGPRRWSASDERRLQELLRSIRQTAAGIPANIMNLSAISGKSRGNPGARQQ